MKNFLLRWIMCVGLFFLAGQSQAADYYVDGSSGVDSNPGTIGSPWKTIDKANKTLIAGDAVFIRGGTYQIGNLVIDGGSVNFQGIRPYQSGTANARITYSAYPGEVVSFEGIADGTRVRATAIDLDDRNYIHITGVSGYNMIFNRMTFNLKIGGNTAGNNNEIDHCDFGTFYDYTLANYKGIQIGHGSQFNYFHDNKVHDWQYYSYYNLPDTDFGYDGPVCMDIGEELGTSSTSYNVIEDNDMYHCGHHVVGLQGKYNIFRNNYLHNEDYWVGPAINTYSDNESHYPTRNIYGYRVFQLGEGVPGNVGNHLVEGNVFGPSGISTHSWYADGINESSMRGGTSFYLCNSYNIIRYNTIFGSVGKGIYFRTYYNGSDDLGETLYNHTYNNTLYNTGYSIENDFNCDERYPIAIDSSVHIRYNVIKNSLFHSTWPQTTNAPDTAEYGSNGCGTRPLTPVYSGTINYQTWSNNLEVPSSSNPADYFVDPDYSNLENEPDYSLRAGASAIDGGEPLATANGSGSNSTMLVLAVTADDPYSSRYFFDGKFGQGITWPEFIVNGTQINADYLCVSSVSNCSQIVSIDYSTNTIVLSSALSWSDGAPVYLQKISGGETVLSGSAPDYGAHEFVEAGSDTTAPASPSGLVVR